MILGAIPAVYLVEHMSVEWLQILVGSMLVIALTVVTFGQSRVPVANEPRLQSLPVSSAGL